MHRFSTPSPPRLTVEFRAGDIRIDTRDVDETTVTLTGRDGDEDSQALVEATVIDQRGGDVVVLVPKRSHGLFGRAPDLQLDITAPLGSRLDVRTASGDVAARGEFGESRVVSGTGDIVIEDLSGATQLRAGSGDVQVRSARADLTVGTGSGSIHIGSAASAVTLQSGSGDVELESATGAVRVQTGSGSIAIWRADDDVRAQTGSGDVVIRRVRRGRVKAQAASGDVRVGVADGTAAWLDVKSVTGDVTSDLDTAQAPGTDEEQIRLELNTVSGDIEIARA